MHRIAIIGAGECGARAAMQLRKLGHTGAISIFSDEADFPYERPPLSKPEEPEPKYIFPIDQYDAEQINLRRDVSASAIDAETRQLRLQDGSTVDYDTLLIASGARARLFPQMHNCLTLRTRADAQALAAHFRTGASIGIIGGGFIGLELAAKARAAGAEATVIEAAPHLMARAIPAAIADHMQRYHAAEGVSIRTDSKVQSADASNIVLIDDTQLHFDAVIAGVGAAPNVELAQAAGIEVDNGIVVDSTFRTSTSGIFAAGDCCNFPWRGQRIRLESWRVAQQQGQHVAAAMLGAVDAYDMVPWSWSDQYDLSIQVAGLYDPAKPVIRRPLNDEAFVLYQCDKTEQLSFAAGVAPGNSIAKDIRIAEKLVAKSARIDPASLSDSSANLKKLLKAA